jgi:rhomboid protease GluP
MPINKDQDWLYQFARKLKYVFLPIFLSSTLTVLILGIARWYLNIQNDILHVSTDVQFWVFILIATIVWAVFIRKPIGILIIKHKPSSDLELLHLLAGLAIFVPLITSQLYLVDKSSKLYQVEHIYGEKNYRENDYFQVSDLELDKSNFGVFYSVHTMGRNNEDVYLNVNYAIPVVGDGGDYRFWIAKRFSKEYGTREYKNNRDTLWQRFVMKTQEEYGHYNPNKHKYLRIIPQSDHRREFVEAIMNSDLYSGIDDDELIILKADDKEFESRSDGEELWFYISYFGINFLILIIIHFLKIQETRLTRLKNNKPINGVDEDDLKELLLFLIPRKDHFITSIMIDINLIVFVWMLASGVSIMHPLSSDLLAFGALRYQEVMDGEYWRLITSGFVHIGIVHILMNMMFLALTGYLAESTLGRWRFLMLYFVTLIGGNINSLLWDDLGVSAGASGALFGLLGWMLAQVLMKRKTNDGSNIVYLFLIFGIGGVTLLVGLFNNSNNAAHLGGLAMGLIIGLAISLFDWIRK